VPSFDVIWSRIQAHHGEIFHQKSGGEFTYSIVDNHIVPMRPKSKARRLPRSHFQRAFERFPVTGPGQLQDLQGPSYLFAILTDPRISS
jgi:hypothetical protein